MTTETDLTTLGGLSFNSNRRTAAIALANKYFGTTDGDSDGDDLATAMLALAVMLNQRQADKGKTDPSITVLNIDQLVTPEMLSLLTRDTIPINYNIIKYQQPIGSPYNG